MSDVEGGGKKERFGGSVHVRTVITGKGEIH